MIWEAYANFLADQNRGSEALKAFQETRRLQPENARAAHSMGETALEIGEIPDAFSAFQDATRLNPQSGLYHFSLANVCFLFRRQIGMEETAAIAEAMEQFSQACTVEPLNMDYARAYAETFYEIPHPNWEEAEKAWKHLLEIAPDKSFAQLNLARVCLKVGKKAEARAWLGKIHDTAYQSVKEKISRQVNGR